MKTNQVSFSANKVSATRRLCKNLTNNGKEVIAQVKKDLLNRDGNETVIFDLTKTVPGKEVIETTVKINKSEQILMGLINRIFNRFHTGKSTAITDFFNSKRFNPRIVLKQEYNSAMKIAEQKQQLAKTEKNIRSAK